MTATAFRLMLIREARDALETLYVDGPFDLDVSLALDQLVVEEDLISFRLALGQRGVAA